MFGRRRIRQLEAEAKVLRDALDWYAVNENWKRRSTHPKGTPVRWEMSPAQKDHGSRARAALTKPRIGALTQPIGLIQRIRLKRETNKAMVDCSKAIGDAAEHLMKRRVTVPAALTPMPESRPTGETA